MFSPCCANFSAFLARVANALAVFVAFSRPRVFMYSLNNGVSTPSAFMRFTTLFILSFSVSASVSVSVSDSINKEALEEFKEHRKLIRKPLSELALKKNIKVLEGCSHEDQQRIVDTTIASGWQGLFPSKDKKIKSIGKIGRAINAFNKG